MAKMRKVRGAAFVTLMLLVIVSAQQDLLAWNSVPSQCQTWNANYDCHCEIETWPEWTASGGCDFSEEGDPQGLANEFCIAMFDACANDCESEDYVESRVEEECDPFNPSDPACYEECWITWAEGNSCEVASEANFSCSCGSFNWCE